MEERDAKDPQRFPDVRELEALLGDPLAKEGPFTFAAALEADERESFPEGAVSALLDWGYLERMIPAGQGGRFASFEEAVALQRCVSRVDLTAAIALGQTFLGSMPVWLAGTDAQKAAQAAILRSGGLAALALTEEKHGADVLHTEVRADAAGPGRVALSGRKWLINNGTRGRALAVFAKEGAFEQWSGFSMFAVDKQALCGEAIVPLPKLRTHGIRGADISGVELREALVSESARLGTVGSGAELLLQTLQITRVGCCGFSLGAADSGLRLATSFALDRRIYGGRAWDIPHARAALGAALVDLVVAECVTTAAARAVHAAPEQLSLISAVAKSFVPLQIDNSLRDAAVVLGARHYLRQGPHAIFQKILRDAAVVSLFDGSLPVNLDGVGTQLLRLSARRAAMPGDREAVLQNIFDLRRPLPPIDGSRLALLTGGRDDVTQGLAGSIDLIRAQPTSPWRDEIEAHARAAVEELARGERELAALVELDREGLKRSAELFELAARHCRLWAAAACVQLWARSGSILGPFFDEGAWLALGLDRLLSPLRSPRPPRRHPALAAATAELQRMISPSSSSGTS